MCVILSFVAVRLLQSRFIHEAPSVQGQDCTVVLGNGAATALAKVGKGGVARQGAAEGMGVPEPGNLARLEEH